MASVVVPSNGFGRAGISGLEESCITSVPYHPTKRVSVYSDLGWSDQTALWFAKHIAGEVRLIG